MGKGIILLHLLVMREIFEDKSLPEERKYRLLPVLVRQLVAQLGHDHLEERVARFSNIQ